MKYTKLILASSLVAALAGCGADVGGNKTVGSVTGGGGGSALDKPWASCNSTSNICTLSGTITEDYTLDPNFEWRIQGWTFVGAGNVAITNAADVTALKANGATLTVPAGVSVKALADAVLVVTRGSKLMAVGTETDPITFSSLDNNFTGQGEWGGIIIQGFAPQYGFGNTGTCVDVNGVCNVSGEGGPDVGKFGGNDPADSSGELKYVRIAEDGLVAGPNNEINGLTLQGVGHGTKIEYVQIHGSLDDAIEWFGGTVNAKHLILTNNDDDDLDYDEGYKGNIQFAFIRKDPVKTGPSGSNDPRGIEANSKVTETKQVMQTTTAISNVSIIGSAVSNLTPQPGILLRGQVTTDLYKVAVANFTKGCLEGKTSELVVGTLTSSLCDDDTSYISGTGIATGFTNINPTLIHFDAQGAITNAEAVIASSTPTAVDNGSGFVFDATAYIGAIDPNVANPNRDWWSAWTIPGSMSSLP